MAVERGQLVSRGIQADPHEWFFGYSGVFADPDGHTWEVSFVNGWTIHAEGGVRLS